MKMATRTESLRDKSQVADAAKAEENASASLESAVGAAFIAAGIGAFVLGLTVIFTEPASLVGFKNFLAFVKPVGPLSGKVFLTVIASAVCWVGLLFAFRSRRVKLTTSFTFSVVGVVLGFLMTFPPVFEFFKNLMGG